MTAPDIADALAPVVAEFERLGVPYGIVGSVASSAHGVARATLDVDLVADLRIEHVDPFVVGISDAYYVDRDAAREAVRRRGVDIYVLPERSFDRESFRRRTMLRVADLLERALAVVQAER